MLTVFGLLYAYTPTQSSQSALPLLCIRGRRERPVSHPLSIGVVITILLQLCLAPNNSSGQHDLPELRPQLSCHLTCHLHSLVTVHTRLCAVSSGKYHGSSSIVNNNNSATQCPFRLRDLDLLSARSDCLEFLFCATVFICTTATRPPIQVSNFGKFCCHLDIQYGIRAVNPVSTLSLQRVCVWPSSAHA